MLNANPLWLKTFTFILLAGLAAAACRDAPTAPHMLRSDATRADKKGGTPGHGGPGKQQRAISISPQADTLKGIGDALRLTATVLDKHGRAAPDADITWTSLHPDVATVDALGNVIARAAGIALITAACGGDADTATVYSRTTEGNEPDTTYAEIYPEVPARRADAFVDAIGVNVHLGYLDRVYGDAFYTIIKPKLQELGVRHLRDKGVVVDSDGWMSKIYGRMEELAARGVRFTLINEPAQGVTDYTHVDHLDRLLQYLDPSAIAAMEGINEHDYSGRTAWAEEVRTFQAALHRRVKEDARLAHVPVLGPSLARPTHGDDVGDLSAYMDFGVMHSYPGGQQPLNNFAYHVENLQPMNGTRPLWATESGYHTALAYEGGHPGVSEAAMGKYVPRLFLQYFRAGVPRTFSYEFIDQGTDPADKEKHFGLLRVDGSEKPAFVALKNLITLLADAGPDFQPTSLSYALSGEADAVQQLLLQKRDGRFYLVLWQDAPSYDLSSGTDLMVHERQITVSFERPMQSAAAFRPLDAAAPAGHWSDVTRLDVSVPDHPVVIELTP